MKSSSVIELADLQNQLHESLTTYVNTGRVSVGAVSEMTATPRVEVTALVDLYKKLRVSDAWGDQVTEITLAPYTDDNPHVNAMMRRLEPLRSHLVAAVVHGSLGSSEEIAYSDFDGLVILRDHVLDDERLLKYVSRRLRAAQSIMIRCDPLQHHGWFVLTEFDLTFLCESHFPTVILRHARGLSPAEEIQIPIRTRDSSRERDAFFRSLAGSLTGERPQRRSLENIYEMKAYLSRLMLLPAAYLQSRDGLGVWKKDSFVAARGDFSESAWECMIAASDIRLSWPIVRRPYFTRMGLGWGWIGRRIRKRLSPKIPRHFRDRLDAGFYSSVDNLVDQMEGRIQVKRTGRTT